MTNRSAPPGTIVPWLAYRDVGKAIEWLCGAFGFTERLRTAPGPGGAIHHAQLWVGLGTVVLTGRDEGGPAQSLFVPVADVDGHYARAKQFGAQVLDAPKTCEFGERQYSVEDLEGHRWTFSQSVADIDPPVWGAQVASIRYPLELLNRPRFCYLLLPALDVAASVAFYEKVFGWNIRGRDGSHPSFDDATGFVSGSWVTDRKPASDSGVLPYIWVNDIEAVLAGVAEAGGEVIERPHLDAPEGELIATFLDPAGNAIGLYEERSR